MSTSRVLSVFVALALFVGVVVTVQAGVATPNAVSHPQAALDQHERHIGFINLSLASAEQARLEFRRGEWSVGNNLYAPLDAHERHAAANMTAEQVRLEFRQGEWYAGRSASPAEFDVEQARLGWRAGK